MKNTLAPRRGMLSALLAIMGEGTKRTVRRVPSEKSQRTPEQVHELKTRAQFKRESKALKRQYDHDSCVAFNPCYKIGKPSQVFLKYEAKVFQSRRRSGLIIVPVHPQ